MSIPASQMIHEFKNFSLSEFPPGALDHVSSNVLHVLQDLRNTWMQSIHPSRHPDGWARFSGRPTSRHYAIGRLADAGDVFPVGNVINFWQLCMAHPDIGGLGIYFDTNRNRLQPGPMIHIDLRPSRLLWSRIGGSYFYFTQKEQIEGHRATYAAMSQYLNSLSV